VAVEGETNIDATSKMHTSDVSFAVIEGADLIDIG
jgi:hypothetical protein